MRRRRRKKISERDLSPISEERRTSKRRLLKLAEDLSSDDQESDIVSEPMNAATPVKQPATRVARPARKDRGIVIKELEAQE